jgi:AcrR family transcriptional regulator
MPRERFLNLPPEARSALLGIAIKEFAARGFDEASLNGILAEAGVSKGAYYYYFEDKEDLFATALEHAIDDALARQPLPSFERLAAADFWPAVERSLREWAARLDTSGDLLRATRHLHGHGARRKSPRLAAVLAKGEALWRALIAAGQRLGCVRTDVPADVLVALVEAADHALDAAYFSAASKPTRRDLEGHVALVFDAIQRLLAVERPAPVGRPPARARKQR